MSNQESSGTFEDIKVIGELSPDEVVAKLRQMGDLDTADEIEGDIVGEGRERAFGGRRRPKPWEYRTHQLGYFPLRPSGSTDPLPIQNAGAIDPDMGLQEHGRINIRLDRLRVWEYPGGFLSGVREHHVMVNFSAQNQLPDLPAEPVSFNQTYRVHDGELAGVQGWPILIGLSFGKQGALFKITTVNVKNSADEALLKVLDSPICQNGLSLLKTAQPVLAPFTDMATGVVKMLVERGKNVAVQRFDLGLDFEGGAGAAFAEGNYIVIQVPSPTAIDWSDWVWDVKNSVLVLKDDPAVSPPYNYLIFRITRYQE